MTFHRAIETPLPGCVCLPSYVRDICHGHPSKGCQYHGLFGHKLAQAQFKAVHPAGLQLEIEGSR
jgi:hypothetical protein